MLAILLRAWLRFWLLVAGVRMVALVRRPSGKVAVVPSISIRVLCVFVNFSFRRLIKLRKKVNPWSDRRRFTRTAQRSKSINLGVQHMRGGIRL